MNTHVVTKQLPVGDRTYQPGDQVDASEWKHARLLVEQRYLKPLDGVAAGSLSATITETEDFDNRVIAAVMKNLQNNGELAQLIQPNGREQRMEKSKPEKRSNN